MKIFSWKFIELYLSYSKRNDKEFEIGQFDIVFIPTIYYCFFDDIGLQYSKITISFLMFSLNFYLSIKE